MKKDINGRQVVREALRITTLVQMGAYILMYQLGQLPENKAVNILLSLALWAICTLASVYKGILHKTTKNGLPTY